MRLLMLLVGVTTILAIPLQPSSLVANANFEGIAGESVIGVASAHSHLVAASEADPWDLGGKIRAYEVVRFDTLDLLSQANAGVVHLPLLHAVFPLLLKEVQLYRPGMIPAVITETGEQIPVTDYAPSRFFQGTVSGVPASRAVLTFTKIGVDGFVQAGNTWIQFEPLQNFRNTAPDGHTVVYQTQDLVRTAGHAPIEETEQPQPATSKRQGSSTLSSQSMKLQGDSAYYVTYSSCWWCKMDNIMNRVYNTYGLSFSWSLTIWGELTCTSTSCDSEEGMTSNSPVTYLSEFAQHQYDSHSSEGWGLSHAFSGKELSSGNSWKVSRYGVEPMVDVGFYYDGGSSNYEAAIVVSHEAGHNFRGDHLLAESYTHCHYWLGWCWEPYTHYTILWPDFRHQPENEEEQPQEFSSDNEEWMNDCNALFHNVPYYAQPNLGVCQT